MAVVVVYPYPAAWSWVVAVVVARCCFCFYPPDADFVSLLVLNVLLHLTLAGTYIPAAAGQVWVFPLHWRSWSANIATDNKICVYYKLRLSDLIIDRFNLTFDCFDVEWHYCVVLHWNEILLLALDEAFVFAAGSALHLTVILAWNHPRFLSDTSDSFHKRLQWSVSIIQQRLMLRYKSIGTNDALPLWECRSEFPTTNHLPWLMLDCSYNQIQADDRVHSV